MSNLKKYITVAITLGAIALCSGLLIGATNLLTAGPIKDNEAREIEKGIKKIYGENASKSETETFESKRFTYVTERYSVLENNVLTGYAYKTEGSNSYGKIALIIGIDSDDFSFEGLYVIKNEQTYASTLVANYINPLNEDKNLEAHDVVCGATYGAKTVRAMIEDAQKAAEELKGKEDV